MRTSIFKTAVMSAAISCLLVACNEMSRIDAPGCNDHNLPDRELSKQDTSFIDDINLLVWPNANDVITADSAVQLCKKMPADQVTDRTYKVSGYICALGTRGDNGGPISFSYGNAYFDIKTHPWSRQSIQCFQIMGLNGEKYVSNDQVYIGQRVIIESKLVNYRGTTPETEGQGKAKVIAWSWRAKAPSVTGNGSKENPYTVADIQAMGASMSQEFQRKGDTVYVRGYINGSAVDMSDYWTLERENFTINSNLMLGDSYPADSATLIPAMLADRKGQPRIDGRLDTHPENIGRKVTIYGVLQNCFAKGITYGINALELIFED